MVSLIAEPHSVNPIVLLPPTYVVRWEGNVLTRFCLSVYRVVPISHNALQHYPECHGADTWGGTQPGPARGEPCRGVPCRGVPCRRYPYRVPPPGRVSPRPGRGGTQLRQQKEYSLHGRWYASCVHAGGLSCLV